MPVDKNTHKSVSTVLPLELLGRIELARRETGQSVSAWLADAARAHLNPVPVQNKPSRGKLATQARTGKASGATNRARLAKHAAAASVGERDVTPIQKGQTR